MKISFVDGQRIRTSWFPPDVSALGYLYVCRWDSGIVKIGRTTRPAARMRSHHIDARRFGIRLDEAWVASRPDPDPAGEEATVLAWVRAREGAEQLAHEYFRGVDFDSTVRYVSHRAARRAARAHPPADDSPVVAAEAPSPPAGLAVPVRPQETDPLDLDGVARALGVSPREAHRIVVKYSCMPSFVDDEGVTRVPLAGLQRWVS